MAEGFKRQVALKTSIAALLAQTAGLSPEQLVNSNFHRVNIIATVVGKDTAEQYPVLVLDDGSAKITARSFEQPQLILNAQIGEVVLLIGKPRTYNNQLYLVPEIIRAVADKRWIAVRLRELAEQRWEVPAQSGEAVPIAAIEKVVEREPGETEGKQGVAERSISAEQLIAAVKQLDSGEGAAVEAVLGQLAAPEAEQVLEQLLLRGELFQLRPGVVKVLE